MKIKEFTDRLKTALPEDMKIESRQGNLAPEGEEPIMGWSVYTYWNDPEVKSMGLAIDLADSVLEKIGKTSVDATSRIIQSARERYDSNRKSIRRGEM